MLSSAQYGFQAWFIQIYKPTQTSIIEALDQNKFSLNVFFDLSKPFDTVDPNILVKKLEYFGIRGIGKSYNIVNRLSIC